MLKHVVVSSGACFATVEQVKATLLEIREQLHNVCNPADGTERWVPVGVTNCPGNGLTFHLAPAPSTIADGVEYVDICLLVALTPGGPHLAEMVDALAVCPVHYAGELLEGAGPNGWWLTVCAWGEPSEAAPAPFNVAFYATEQGVLYHGQPAWNEANN